MNKAQLQKELLEKENLLALAIDVINGKTDEIPAELSQEIERREILNQVSMVKEIKETPLIEAILLLRSGTDFYVTETLRKRLYRSFKFDAELKSVSRKTHNEVVKFLLDYQKPTLKNREHMIRCYSIKSFLETAKNYRERMENCLDQNAFANRILKLHENTYPETLAVRQKIANTFIPISICRKYYNMGYDNNHSATNECWNDARHVLKNTDKETNEVEIINQLNWFWRQGYNLKKKKQKEILSA